MIHINKVSEMKSELGYLKLYILQINKSNIDWSSDEMNLTFNKLQNTFESLKAKFFIMRSDPLVLEHFGNEWKIFKDEMTSYMDKLSKLINDTSGSQATISSGKPNYESVNESIQNLINGIELDLKNPL